MIHREALASKTSPLFLNLVIQEVNIIAIYLKSSALNTCLYQKLCSEMDAVKKNLLYHTEVRSLQASLY